MLIVYANTNKKGHSGEILNEITQDLKEKGVNYEIIDLYDMNFDPVLKFDEHYTMGNKNITETNKKIQEKFMSYDKFIFIYPTWWNSVPAILKGFIDRVFVGGFAFKYEKGFPKPLLNGKAAIFTTTGAPRLITKFYYRDSTVKFMTHDTLKFCGIKAKGYVIDEANRLNEKQKIKIKKAVRKGLNYLYK